MLTDCVPTTWEISGKLTHFEKRSVHHIAPFRTRVLCCVSMTFIFLVSLLSRAAFQDESGLEQMIKSLDSMQGINLVQTTGGGPYDLRQYIPHQMRPLIDCSPMREHADHYWWRAVSATYITRPNRATLALLATHTTLPVLDYKDTVAMFVRHGDKVNFWYIYAFAVVLRSGIVLKAYMQFLTFAGD